MPRPRRRRNPEGRLPAQGDGIVNGGLLRRGLSSETDEESVLERGGPRDLHGRRGLTEEGVLGLDGPLDLRGHRRLVEEGVLQLDGPLDLRGRRRLVGGGVLERGGLRDLRGRRGIVEVLQPSLDSTAP